MTTLRLLLAFLCVPAASCAVAPWENADAPSVVTAALLCEHLAESACPQGLDENCVENNELSSEELPACEDARNDLRRCYFIDLPADGDEERAIDPFTCVLSDACANESDALCRCERGDACDVDA